ncbi:hypothetical protein [Paramagnetospirillum magneticum]|uniref:Uncharacterized protein n=1 Tax=Paramagnetospirillum magneticum (strain ATCC 700264 / AMB-1) TaxID=342108 RepID=Q2W615_PARM1|nr:hypothetical protein [Paramagnetospirillum magneticum]BAE50710.1 hypothetical protein amb1906 [Paramagnetospirillum magneticum AMB-1]
MVSAFASPLCPSRTAPGPAWPVPAAPALGLTRGFGGYRYGAAPIQRVTTIQYGPLQNFTYRWSPALADSVTAQVGSRMHAELDPANPPPQGSDTNSSTAFDPLFRALKDHPTPGTGTTNWVRGHLLNHDLGGTANFSNLFPLTGNANGEHKDEVELPIKHWIDQGAEVTYDVQAVQEQPATGSPDGAFICSANVTQANGSGLGGKAIRKVIYSHGKDRANTTREFNGAPDQAPNLYSGVQIGAGNNTFRNDPHGHGWGHRHGNMADNAAIAATALADIDTSTWDNGGNQVVGSGLTYGANFGQAQLDAFRGIGGQAQPNGGGGMSTAMKILLALITVLGAGAVFLLLKSLGGSGDAEAGNLDL